MRVVFPLAVLTAGLLAAAPAARANSFVLDKVEINGVKSVPADQLVAGLKDHAGDKVTTDDLIADQDALAKELEAAHVVGGIQTAMRNKNNGHIDLIFNVTDKGVQAPTTVTVAPKLGTQTFVGNTALSSDELAAATALKPGDELSDAKIQAAEAAILDAYKKAKKVGVQIAGSVKQNGAVADLTWTLTETKQKKKKRNDEDFGAQGGDQ
jgi:outer membrane protein assembly factor BamA